MNTLTFITLILLQQTVALKTDDKKGKTGLRLESFSPLGKFSRNFDPCDGHGFNQKDFMKFRGFVDWQTAEKGCQEMNKSFSLISLDSREKNDFVQCLLHSNGDAGSFWTSGRFDGEVRSFVWHKSGIQLPSWAPWAPSHPPKFPTTQLRVALERSVAGGNITWKTISIRDGFISFICEGSPSSSTEPPPRPTTTEPPIFTTEATTSKPISSTEPTIRPTSTQPPLFTTEAPTQNPISSTTLKPITGGKPRPKGLDVLFLVDNAGVTSSFFLQMRFVSSLIARLYESEGTKAGVFVYVDRVDPDVVVPLDNNFSATEIAERLSANRPPFCCLTGWVRVLREAVRHYNLHGRRGLRRNVVLFADNSPSESSAEALEERKTVLRETERAGLFFHCVSLYNNITELWSLAADSGRCWFIPGRAESDLFAVLEPIVSSIHRDPDSGTNPEDHCEKNGLLY